MRSVLIQPPYGEAEQAMGFQRKALSALKRGGCDLVLLPEYCNATGIASAAAMRRWIAGEGRKHMLWLKKEAARLECLVAACGVVEDSAGRLRNRLMFYGPEEKCVGWIDKMHLTAEERKLGIQPADSVRIVEYRGLRIAAAVCFDIYFPEYFSMLCAKKADLILAPSYQRGETASRIEALCRIRALDAGAYLVRASYSVNDSPDYAGRSLVASPTGEILACAGGTAQVLQVNFDPSQKYLKRAYFQGPETTHAALIESARREPFYRHGECRRRRPGICAHRGLSAAIPENTIPAFAAALAVGADEIEFDVYLTRDGVPVIVHDQDLRRVAQVEARVEELSWPEIQAIDLGRVYGRQWRNLRIPRLEQVLDLCNGTTGLNIHMKMAGPQGEAIRIVADELRRRNLLECAYVGGEADILEALLKWAPEVTRSCMAKQEDSDALIENARRYHCPRLQFFSSVVEEKHVQKAHDLGIHCNVFYADSPEEMQRMIRMGIDTVLTNYAGEFLQTFILEDDT